MINLNRPTCDDDAIVRQSRIVAFDAIARRAPREPAPTPYEVAVYAFECEDHSAQEQAKPTDAVSHRPGDPPMGTLADMIADCTPASGAALVGTKPQPDANTLPLKVGDRVQVLPHPAGARHPTPFVPSMDEFVNMTGEVILCDASDARVRFDSGQARWFPLSSVCRKPAAIPGWRKKPPQGA